MIARGAVAVVVGSALVACALVGSVARAGSAADGVAAPPLRGITLDLADEADLQYRLGVRAYDARDFEHALEHLLASNRLVPNRNVVFNLARVYEQLGETDDAWRYYDEYVRVEPDAAARAEGEQGLARLEASVARVRIGSEPAGATVYLERVDLGSRGQTPLTLALPEGEHQVLLELDGFEPTARTVSVAVGALTELDVALGVPAGPPPPDAPWVAATVSSGSTVVARVEPDQCSVLGVPGRYDGPPASLGDTGSSLGATVEADGLVLDVERRAAGFARHVMRTPVAPVSKRSIVLADPAPLHDALFVRCRPLDGAGIAAALVALPKATRRDAARLVAEWAAWRGAPDAATAAAGCVGGDCAALADLVTR
ncbi:MAG: PEGA domain-containing protein [Myxococcota bacterium]